MIRAANILIVDDLQPNRETLEHLTAALGHTPISAENGIVALSIITKQPIDLVLLDVMMPDMDGYEVLSQIKDNPTWRHIPVIMISALDEMSSVIHCIKMGADDYLTKPFDVVLLRARIAACLERKFLRDQEQIYRQQIEAYNRTLEERVQERTQELTEAKEQLERINQVKNEVLSVLYYEFQKPFRGLIDIFKQRFTERVQDIHNLFETMTHSVLVTQLEPTNRIYPFEISNISTILTTAIESSRHFAQSRQVSLGEIPSCGEQAIDQEELYTLISSELIDIEEEMDAYPVSSLVQRFQQDDDRHKKLCTEAIMELLKTAVKFANPNSTITLSCEPRATEIELIIHATGRLIANDTLPYFFQASSAHTTTLGRHPGLGPSIALHIIESLGGTVTVQNRGDAGISFTVTLKREQL